jgi:hypothetical protein
VLAPNAKWRREVVGFGHSKAASESSSSGAGSEVQPLDRCVPLALVALSLVLWGAAEVPGQRLFTRCPKMAVFGPLARNVSIPCPTRPPSARFLSPDVDGFCKC